MLVTAASRDITPRAECPLAGFAGRSATFEGVASPLEANIALFRNDSGRCAAIMTIDTLFVGAELECRLSTHFTDRYRQNRRDFLVVASHTHFAPGLDRSKPALGRVDADYAAFVERECISLIDAAMALPPVRARCEHGIGVSEAAINRRLRWPLPHLVGRRLVPPQTVMAPNAAGPIDRTINAWSILSEAGNPVALIWHFACHPTGYPKSLHVSADFPGLIRDKLRHQFGPVPVLFLQGFAGDLRPVVPETRSIMRRTADAAIFGPSFDKFSIDSWVSWSSNLGEDVLAAFSAPRRSSSSNVPLASSECAISMTEVVDCVDDRLISFRRLQVCQDLDIIAVGAEPLTTLRSFLPVERAVAVGYLGDVFGYWPADSDSMLGGYEVNHFLEPFGLRGKLKENLDVTFRAAAGNLLSLR